MRMLQMKKRRRTRTSQFRGVTRAGARWRAAIRINNIKRELGIFDSEAEAARCVLSTALHRCIGLSLQSNKFIMKGMLSAAVRPLFASPLQFPLSWHIGYWVHLTDCIGLHALWLSWTACCGRAYDAEALQMFGPTATLNFGAPAPSPGEAAAQVQQPQPSETFPAAVPDGAQQLAMLASPPVNYQQAPDLSPPITIPPPAEAQQGSQQGEQLAF